METNPLDATASSTAAGGVMTQGMRDHRAFVLVAMINRRKRKSS